MKIAGLKKMMALVLAGFSLPISFAACEKGTGQGPVQSEATMVKPEPTSTTTSSQTPEVYLPPSGFKLLKPNSTYRPDKGYAPDAVTAIRIAEAVWLPIYGQSVLSERPHSAMLVGDVWVVQGYMPEDSLGGTAYAEISRKTSCVLNVIHYK